MAKKEYLGTSGLNIVTAFNRIKELMEKQPLGGQDEKFYEEAKSIIDTELNDRLMDAEYWNRIESKLTAKQLLFVLKGK